MKKIHMIMLSMITFVLMAFTSFAATEIGLNLDWEYAGNSKINTGKAILFTSDADERKGITVAVNAGHGTKGGSSKKTLCHPDGSPKCTGGSTGKGAIKATAVSGGMTFLDGTPEAQVTLDMAHIFAKDLLDDGYDVLLIRRDEDVQLDNIARTVIANNKADCHIALHWDSSKSNKGAFYISTPEKLRKMYPVSECWEKHERLGESLVGGLKDNNIKIFSNGKMAIDLTQTSYSTIPSVDIELGDKKSDHSKKQLMKLSKGLVDGVNKYYRFEN